MPVFKATRMSLLVRSAVGSFVLFGISPVVHGLSIVAPGETRTLRPGELLDSWEVQSGATLNVNGANTQSIRTTAATLNMTDGSSAENITLGIGSQADIAGANITGGAASAGLRLTASSAQILNSDINATTNAFATGLELNSAGSTGQGSAVTMSGGSVTGSLGGVSTSVHSTLILNNVQVSGVRADGFGLRAFSSEIGVTGGSVHGGLNGIQYFADPTAPREGTMSLSSTSVTGDNGAAIAFDGLGLGLVANLQLLDGTTLKGGNGNALEINGDATLNALVRNSLLNGTFAVTNGSTGNFTFDNASLTGDISADQTSSAHVTMANNSSLTGNLINVDSAALDGSSFTGEYMVNDSRTANLTLQNGSQFTGNLTNVDRATLDGSSFEGNYAIGDTRTGDLTLRNGSQFNGNVNNVDSVALERSAFTGDYTITDGRNSTLTLQNGSQFTGNLINVDRARLDGSSFDGDYTISDIRTGDLTLRNGSQFTGNVSNVDSVALERSAFTGDYTITDGRNGTLTLQNGSQFTGNLINVEGLTLAGQSLWNMVASNSVGVLSINDGTVKFGAPDEFFQLDVGTLAGNGTFVMDADFATNQHDVLNVTGSATGTHSLLIAGSGVDPVSPEPLTVVRTGGGDATFALAGAGVVDVGTFSYALNSVDNGSSGTDWFLDPSTKTISPGTASVLALFNTAPTVWYGELTSLRSRMGELRFNGGKAGGWVRTYGNKYNVSESSGVGYQQTQQGFSLGADAPLPVGDGQWLVGVLAGHSKSDLDLNRGTSGTVKSYYAGLYTTWLDQASGYYFDGVIKANRFRNDSKVSISDGTRAKGDYDNSGVGGSVEFGRHIKLDDGYFVEPFTQLSAVVIQGKDYHLNNDMQAEGDRTRSLLGKVGATAGRNFTLSDGKVVQPYVRAAGVHEFAKNNKVQVNNNTFNNDLSGSRAELGAGVAVAFSDNLQLHADFDYSNGQHIEQPFGANVGLRYSW